MKEVTIWDLFTKEAGRDFEILRIAIFANGGKGRQDANILRDL